MPARGALGNEIVRLRLLLFFLRAVLDTATQAGKFELARICARHAAESEMMAARAQAGPSKIKPAQAVRMLCCQAWSARPARSLVKAVLRRTERAVRLRLQVARRVRNAQSSSVAWYGVSERVLTTVMCSLCPSTVTWILSLL